LETFFLSNLERNDLAISYLKKLSKSSAGNIKSKYITILSYLTSRSDEDQIFYLKQLLDNKEAKKFCSFRLMKLYLRLNKYEEALEFADEAKKFDHSNFNLYYYYLVIYKNLRYLSKAVYIIEELERHYKEHITAEISTEIVQVLKVAAKYHLENNEDYEAEHYIKHLLNYLPGDLETIKQLTTIYEGRKKQDEVKETIKNGYSQKPSYELIELYVNIAGITREEALREFAQISQTSESILAIFNFAFNNKLEDKLSQIRKVINKEESTDNKS
jgi:tetratricopeptide (TPR) repeat protein